MVIVNLFDNLPVIALVVSIDAGFESVIQVVFIRVSVY